MNRVFILGSGASHGARIRGLPAGLPLQRKWSEAEHSLPPARREHYQEMLLSWLYSEFRVAADDLVNLEELACLIDARTAWLRMMGSHKTAKYPRLAREWIADILLCTLRKRSERARCEDHDRLCLSLSKSDTIISLNWDVIVDWSLGHTGLAGFPASYLCDFTSVNRRDGPPVDGAHVALLKLHGSLNWFAELSPDGSVAGTCEVHPDDLLEVDLPANWSPLLLTPTYEKSIPVEAFPFLFRPIWSEAEKRLVAARQLIVVGYSFPATDHDVRCLFWRTLRVQEHPLSIHIVDPECRQVRDRLERFCGSRSVNWVYHTCLQEYLRSSERKTRVSEKPMDAHQNLIVVDGGGTVWHSMRVLWEHYQTAFSYFGLLRPDEFARRFPCRPVTEISSLRSFNSRRNMPLALLGMYFCNVSPETVLERRVLGREGLAPEQCLHDLTIEAWKRCTRRCFEQMAKDMGTFLAEALYHFDDSHYPLCTGAREGLLELRQAGFHIAMISNRRFASTMAILRNLGVADLFDHVEAPLDSDEPVVKPVGKVMERYGIANEHRWKAVFIGDSNLDIASAHDQGLLTAAVTTGMGSPRVLEYEQPAAIVDDIFEAAQLLQFIMPFRERAWREHVTRLGKCRRGISLGQAGVEVLSELGQRSHGNRKALQPEKVHLLAEEGGEVSLGQLHDHGDAEEKGLPQACVYIAVVDQDGRVYIQHRSHKKRLHPDLKTISASGHVDPGETFEQAAVRELYEELGITCPAEDLRRVGSFSGLPHCGPVFQVRTGQKPAPNGDELDAQESGFVPVERLRLLLKCRVLFTPGGIVALRTWLRAAGSE